jgi:hypothetical protein
VPCRLDVEHPAAAPGLLNREADRAKLTVQPRPRLRVADRRLREANAPLPGHLSFTIHLERAELWLQPAQVQAQVRGFHVLPALRPDHPRPAPDRLQPHPVAAQNRVHVIPARALAGHRLQRRRHRFALENIHPRVVRAPHRITTVDRGTLLPIEPLRHSDRRAGDVRDLSQIAFAELLAPRHVPIDLRTCGSFANNCTNCYDIAMPRIATTIFDLASEHDGVFTAAEAADAGISHEALAMSARRGTIRRLSRGIYRLVAYPSNEEQVQLWEAVLWPTTRRGPVAEWGVLSHLTALRLNYALLEYTPPKVSITIPSALRIRRTPPAWLKIHRADLPDNDVTSNIGPPVTTLERTLRDCIDAGVEHRLLRRVLEDSHLADVMSAEQIADFRGRIR